MNRRFFKFNQFAQVKPKIRSRKKLTSPNIFEFFFWIVARFFDSIYIVYVCFLSMNSSEFTHIKFCLVKRGKNFWPSNFIDFTVGYIMSGFFLLQLYSSNFSTNVTFNFSSIEGLFELKFYKNMFIDHYSIKVFH